MVGFKPSIKFLKWIRKRYNNKGNYKERRCSGFGSAKWRGTGRESKKGR